jgi:hypothetical protein
MIGGRLKIIRPAGAANLKAFMVNQSGVICEKDLGLRTPANAFWG